MTKRMLIDASHPEESRVVVLDGTRLEEYDVETSTKAQLKSNIYLAKVVRVEPSLQAAFVDYGGNRHGFLAFSEIHPDYYQIPRADREALLAELEASRRNDDDVEFVTAPTARDADDAITLESDEGSAEDADAEPETADKQTDEPAPEQAEQAEQDDHGGNDEDPAARHKAILAKRYKIQEVIKKRQILLIQVVKEERGNKGAALTTYLSLAGRYCVLMPNNARGGGISRKISNAADRKRLKTILAELNIPGGMGVIVRTAGAERTKAEIKRDYDYLIRTWAQIRETTLESTAPALIHQEGDIIKRAIRDIYRKDVEEILIDGEAHHRSAKAFMKLLMPSHVRKVKLYKDDPLPLFQRYQVEGQLEAMHSPTVGLRSGGSIVLNQTEALVAIDVNSGRATRERHITETALKTNLEAADEIARQLRLRDLAGLVVIDFIDMDENRHNQQVERRLKEALKIDRARIQVGRISSFGLLELSRQRLRPSVIEGSYHTCPTCQGTGVVRSVGSSAMALLRVIEEEAARDRAKAITVTTHPDVALYVLNHKRAVLNAIEARTGLTVYLEGDASLVPPDHRIALDRTPGAEAENDDAPPAEPQREQRRFAREEDRAPALDEEESSDPDTDSGDEDSPNRKRRRRRRRRGRGRGEDQTETAAVDSVAQDHEDPAESTEAASDEAAGEDDAKPRRSRRRGGRGRRGGAQDNAAEASNGEATVDPAEMEQPAVVEAAPAPETDAPSSPLSDEAPAPATPANDPAPAPKLEAPVFSTTPTVRRIGESGDADTEESSTPRRGGWWQRLTGSSS